MNNQDAIKSLKNIVEYWTCRPTEIEAAELSISALEKQIPKKPINHYDCHWLCPICDELICDNNYGVEESYKFCNNCGQAIDWRCEDE